MEQALVRQEDRQILLSPVMNIELAKARLMEFQAFVKDYLKEGEDFGTIPGTPKPTLLKPGSDKLCELYGLADTYEITNRVEDWEKNLFDYEVQCTLLSKRDGGIVSTGLGSCNSYEGKYRWRDSQRRCPKCEQPTIIKGKEQFGGGWLCWAKKGGCGAKFPEGEKAIESQQLGRVENDDIPTIKNTILKMAKKRAKVDATLAATRSSGIFTQDIEDFPDFSTAPSTVPQKQEEKEKPDPLRPTPAGDIEINLAKSCLLAVMDAECFTDVDRKGCKQWLGKNPTLAAVKKKLREKQEWVEAWQKETAAASQENPDGDSLIPGSTSSQEAF